MGAGLTALGLAASGLLILSYYDADQASRVRTYDPTSVETTKRLWIEADALESVATCYTNVLRDAGVLQEPIESNADLVAAHESMSDEQQQSMDNCREISEPNTGLSRLDPA